MRIISGKHKGRRLNIPKNLPVRPTTDRAREALFNILWNRFNFFELKILDLFAGTGAISFEFASRGVPEITAVDSDYGCINFIKKTSKDLNAPILTFKKDVFSFLQETGNQYDLIFADPPYGLEREEFENIIDSVFQRNLLEPQGLLVLEHLKQMDFSTANYFLENRKYGDSVFSFFTETPA